MGSVFSPLDSSASGAVVNTDSYVIGPEFSTTQTKFLDVISKTITESVSHYTLDKQAFKKVEKLNKKIDFSRLSSIPKFCWNRIVVDGNTTEHVYAQGEVNDVLKSMCATKEPGSPEQKFIFGQDYWDHAELNKKICKAVTIVHKQYPEEEQQNFLTEFCSGARGVDGQCGIDRHVQVSLTVDRVIMGVFGSGKKVNLDFLIKKEIYGLVIQASKEKFIELGYGEEDENRRDYQKILSDSEEGKGLPKPEIAAKGILTAVQNHFLMSPGKWRKLLENIHSSKAFLTSSKNKLGQTLAVVLGQDHCQLSIRSILLRMEKLGLLKQKENTVHNDYDCLELLALSRKLPEKLSNEDSVIDQPTLKAAINHYFQPASALINGLKEIMLHGRSEQIDLMHQILEGTPEMVLLDEAIALNLSTKI